MVVRTRETESGVPAPPCAAAPWRGGIRSAVQFCDDALETLCVGLLIGTVAVVVLQVFCRYVLNNALSWPEELSRWAFVWLIFVGMAVGVRRQSHMAIDLVSGYLPAGARPALGFLQQSAVATTSVAMAVHGWALASRASYISPAMEWHYRYLYLAIPVGAVLNLYYLVRRRISDERAPVSGALSVVAGGAAYLALVAYGPALLASWNPAAAVVVLALAIMAVGVPVGFALTLAAYIASLARGELFLMTVSHNMATSVDSFVLLAIPFFLLAGGLMNAGGITEQLARLATALVGHLRGGLGHVNALVNAMLAGLSGSSLADAAGIAKVLVPPMEARGYDRAFSAALTSAGGVLANIIPPSIGMILYSAMASVSIGALFMAGVVPGLLMTLAIMLVVYVQSVRRGYGRDCARASVADILRATWGAAPGLLMPAAIVGGIWFGVFTATEAGAAGALYALLVGLFVYRGLNWRAAPRVAREAALETVGVMFILGASAPFAWLLVVEQVPQAIAREMGELAARPLLLLLLVNLFLLVVGLPLEMAPALVILVPILLPIITKAGIDPVHFGVIMIINLILGSLTPPVGLLVFITAGIARVPVGRVFWEVTPFLLVMLFVLLIVTIVPSISLFLPGVLGPR